MSGSSGCMNRMSPFSDTLNENKRKKPAKSQLCNTRYVAHS